MIKAPAGINTIFAENLRELCERRGTQAAMGRALGLTKVQLQRYLRGDSFPKPDVLQRLCLYFGTDARILTMRLHEISAPAPHPSIATAQDSGLSEAWHFAVQGEDLFSPSEDLPDGLYTVWRRSFLSQDTCFRTVMQIKTLSHARVLRSFEPRNSPISVAHEYRGVVYRQAQGFVVHIYYPEPMNSFAQVFLNPFIVGAGRRSLLGYMALGREEFPGITRLSRMLWEPIAPNFRAAMAAYRKTGLIRNADVPHSVASLILPPVI